MLEEKNKAASVGLVVDSGSTKTDWCVCIDGKQVCRCITQGINPFHQSDDYIYNIIGEELKPKLKAAFTNQNLGEPSVRSIRFYGAGCRGAAIEGLRKILLSAFPEATEIEVGSDLLAAAHAVCGSEEGIACILGTGANSGLYDGKTIIANVSPLGYILGDEGSGAVLGKLFINGLFKGDVPSTIREEFLETTGQTLDDIIRRVYREPMANRYLASLSPFIRSHIDCREVRDIVVRNFVDFFRLNVDHYGHKDLAIGAVGSVAYYYRDELNEAARLCGYKMGKIVKSLFEFEG